ncbi:MAG: hypothetical protein KDG50_15270 [Chromatiales bacterium]|nr:hypothetical protein [Chromatiales bacterium]
MERLLARYGLLFEAIHGDSDLPGSHWGDPEAGVIGHTVFARPTTPVHSVLHEACHVVCMDRSRRARLDTDAGGDYDEENGVCYLQIVLADHVDHYGRARCEQDMDAWGYSFRLGSARAWFEQDAQDAREWLLGHSLIDPDNAPTWRLRD